MAEPALSLEGLSLEPLLGDGEAEGDWVDLLPALAQAAQGLGVSELLQGSLFSLGEAMSALEMMHPQMDSGMEGNSPTAASVPEAWNLDELRPRWPRALSARETLGCLDELFALLLLFLRGHSLAQTVFQCAWAHAPDVLGCSLLHLYVVGTLRIADAAHVAVVRGNVCEEEDFSASTSGLPLALEVSDAELLEGFAVAEALLAAQLARVAAAPPQGAAAAPAAGLGDLPAGWEMVGEASAAELGALQCRLRLLRALFALISPLRKHTPARPLALSGEPAAAHEVALAELARVLASLGYGSPPEELGFSFSKACTAHVRGSAPQRLLPPVERGEACAACAELVTQLQCVPRLLDAPNLDELLLGYQNLCARTTLQPLARTALRIVVLCAHEADRTSPKALSSYVKGSLRLMHQALGAEQIAKLLARKDVSAAVDRMAHGLLIHLQIYCHNDARRRRKLGKLLLDWGAVQLEVEEADAVLLREEAVGAEQWLLSAWISAHSTLMMAEQLRLGFRLQLYHPSELHSVLWYLHNLFAFGANLYGMLDRSNAAAAEHESREAAARAAGPRSKGWAKRKQHGEVLPAGPSARTPTLLLYEAQRELAHGIHLLLSGLIREGVLAVADGEFISLRERFERRFVHLHNLLQPQPPSFERYSLMLQLEPHAPATLYTAAANRLKAARVPLDAALKWAHCAVSAELAKEVRAMLKVSVQNGVAAMQLQLRSGATPPGPPPARVTWQFAPDCDYPVLVLPS